MPCYILKTIRYFDIARQIGYVAGDNAGLNNTCLRALLRALEAEYIVKFNAVQRRIRCGGYIINLYLKVFLFASSTKALKAAIIEALVDKNILVTESYRYS